VQCVDDDSLRLIKGGFDLKTAEFAARGDHSGAGMLEAEAVEGDALLAGEGQHQTLVRNHTLAVPAEHPEAVCVTIFLSDVEEAGGAPCIVPHAGGAWPRGLTAASKSAHADLYAAERAVYYKTGTGKPPSQSVIACGS
jgi:hypothetical protein